MQEYAVKFIEHFGPPTGVAILFYLLWLGPRSGWSFSPRRLRNAGTNIVMVMANVSIKASIVMGLGALSVTALDKSSLPHIPSEYWEGLLPGTAILAALLTLDFINYWAHRLLHTPLIWGVHAIHHADDDMSWTTTYRIHFLESFIMGGCFFVMGGWLNLPVEALGAASVIRIWYSYYTHTQSGFDHGAFRRVLVSPNYHRWHHANVKEAYDKNLADMFPLWDVWFGTHYNPGKCEAQLGLGDDVPKGVVLSLSYPFKYWAAMLGEYFKGKSEKANLLP